MVLAGSLPELLLGGGCRVVSVILFYILSFLATFLVTGWVTLREVTVRDGAEQQDGK